MKKYISGLVLLVFVAMLFATPSLIVTRLANATPNVIHEWHGTHRYFDNNGNYCYTESRFTTTGEEYNHPAPTIEYVYDTIPDPDDPTVVTIIRIPIEVHTDHNVTINIHRDTYHHYLSGPCS